MKRQTLWVAIALMMATTWTSCSSDDSEDITQQPAQEQPGANSGSDDEQDPGDDPLTGDSIVECFALTRAEQQLVESGNDFAFNLFRRAREEGKSLILSPVSITYALGMLNNGAVGETQQQINQVLGFAAAGADGINNFCRKMLYSAPRVDSLTKVLIANTIYVNQGRGCVLQPEFVKKANFYYEATPESRDFADGKTMDVINQWASDHTEGMIDKVLDGNSFNPLSVSYLLNAIYFKGEWTLPFDKYATRDEVFEGAQKKVPTMWMMETLGYMDDDNCQALCLPYGNGAFRMTVLLPHKDKCIDDVLQGLTAEKWHRYQNLGETLVDVRMPRFESNTDLRLEEIMTDLGMPRAFSPWDAELPNFCNTDVYIAMMKQVARIKVNEEGSEAAAVTIIGLDGKEGPGHMPSYEEFHATRPFLYFISEQSTGAIFFIGQYLGD